jgi:voltage-gated sodium channel
LTARLQKIVEDPRTDRVIMGLIVLNAITLGLETNQAAMERFGPLLTALDRAVLAVFVIEIAARLVVHRAAFFRDGWNIFDFVVIGISLAPTTEAFTVLRALRILRVLRLITVVPSLRRVVGGLIAALPGMGSIVVLLSLLYYVFSVMATKLFGGAFPEWFGTIGASAYSLFQIMTLESWSMGIVRPVMEKFPYAWAFFVPYIIVTTFAVLNLFIGVVVSAMQAEHEKELTEEREAERSAEREMMHQETEPLVLELRALKSEIVALRSEVEGLRGSP